jgi:hypothetical protein
MAISADAQDPMSLADVTTLLAVVGDSGYSLAYYISQRIPCGAAQINNQLIRLIFSI